jgi:hypothetical protein
MVERDSCNPSASRLATTADTTAAKPCTAPPVTICGTSHLATAATSKFTTRQYACSSVATTASADQCVSGSDRGAVHEPVCVRGEGTIAPSGYFLLRKSSTIVPTIYALMLLANLPPPLMTIYLAPPHTSPTVVKSIQGPGPCPRRLRRPQIPRSSVHFLPCRHQLVCVSKHLVVLCMTMYAQATHVLWHDKVLDSSRLTAPTLPARGHVQMLQTVFQHIGVYSAKGVSQFLQGSAGNVVECTGHQCVVTQARRPSLAELLQEALWRCCCWVLLGHWPGDAGGS